MNSNYSWQRHQASERIQARLDEARIHRSRTRHSKEGKHLFSSLAGIARRPASGLAAFKGWLFTNVAGLNLQVTDRFRHQAR